MTASVLLTYTSINSGTATSILCNKVSFGGKKSNGRKPIPGMSDYPVEVQTSSIENMKISVSGVHFTNASGTLTWPDVLSLYQQNYDGTNYATLNVVYGSGTGSTMTGIDGSTDIKVVLESFDFPIDVTDSRDAYLPVGNLMFVETK